MWIYSSTPPTHKSSCCAEGQFYLHNVVGGRTCIDFSKTKTFSFMPSIHLKVIVLSYKQPNCNITSFTPKSISSQCCVSKCMLLLNSSLAENPLFTWPESNRWFMAVSCLLHLQAPFHCKFILDTGFIQTWTLYCKSQLISWNAMHGI